MDRQGDVDDSVHEPTEAEWEAALAKALEDDEHGTGEEGFGIYLPMFPYLPLREPVAIDEWQLIPFRLERPEPTSDLDREVELAIDAYRPARDGFDFGALCSPARPNADPTLHEELFWPLSQAVLAAMLYANPRLGEHDTWCDCRKHGTTTAENAHLAVVALGAEFVPSHSGSRITRTMTMLRKPGDPYTVPPPEALYLPDGANDLDGDLATAIYRALLRDNDVGRRLDNAIAWLDFIAANGTSVVPSMRIMSLRSAFEALFGESRTAQLRTVVGDLLAPRAPKVARSWQEHGKTRSADLSDREWWFQRFSLLRNGLTHGSSMEDAAWVHDGLAHTHIAQEALVEAIAAVATAAEAEATALPPSS